MAGVGTRSGAAKIYAPVKTNTLLPNCSTLVFTASANTPSTLVQNDETPILDTTASYYVCLAPLGEDRESGGLGITAASPVTGPITVTAGQGIAVTIAASNFPANLNKAFAIGVFVKKNSGDFQLQGYGYIDATGNNFEYMICTEPAVAALTYSQTLLQATTADTALGLDRTAIYGISYIPVTPTSGGITVDRTPEQMQINPDNGPQYSLAISRNSTISFSSLANDTLDIIRANAGKGATYTAPNGNTITVGNMSMRSATAVLSGNLPYKLVLPADQNRVVETRVYLATISANQSGGQELWGKQSPTLIQWTVQPISNDYLLNDIDVEICFKRRQ